MAKWLFSGWSSTPTTLLMCQGIVLMTTDVFQPDKAHYRWIAVLNKEILLLLLLLLLWLVVWKHSVDMSLEQIWACVSDWWGWCLASVSVIGLAAVHVGVLYHVWVPAVGNTAGGHSAMWHDIEDKFCHYLESVYCGFWPHVLENSIYTARHSNTVFASGITNSTYNVTLGIGNWVYSGTSL